MRREFKERVGGFTLVELMVVVIILGILAATVIPQFMGTTQDAKATMAKVNIKTLQSCLERFNLNMDRYPTSEEGLKALIHPPAEAGTKWKGPYLGEVPLDPWDHPFVYRCPGAEGRKYEIWSRGDDGVDGGEGFNADITSWSQPRE